MKTSSDSNIGMRTDARIGKKNAEKQTERGKKKKECNANRKINDLIIVITFLVQ